MGFGEPDTVVAGLYKRNHPTGAVWAVKARQRGAGKSVTVTVGKCSVISLREARQLARGYLYQLSTGTNPNEERRYERARREASAKTEEERDITLAAAITRYLKYGKRKPKTIKDFHSTIYRNFSDWLSFPARQITRAMCEKRFEAIKARVKRRLEEQNQSMAKHGKTPKIYNSEPGQGEAQRAFRYLRAALKPLCNEIIDGQRLLEHDPTQVLRDIRATYQIPARRTHLKVEQIEQLFEVFNDNHRTRNYFRKNEELPFTVQSIDEDFVVLLLLTGARKEEILSLKLTDLDMRAKTFTFQDTKNGRPHTIPMTDTMHTVIARRKKASDKVGSPWLFPSPINPATKGTMSRCFERVCGQLGFTFTPHDLRRTFATTANDIGFSQDKIGQALNHKGKGVTSGYIQVTTDSLRKTFEKVEYVMLRKWEDAPAQHQSGH